MIATVCGWVSAAWKRVRAAFAAPRVRLFASAACIGVLGGLGFGASDRAKVAPRARGLLGAHLDFSRAAFAGMGGALFIKLASCEGASPVGTVTAALVFWISAAGAALAGGRAAEWLGRPKSEDPRPPGRVMRLVGDH